MGIFLELIVHADILLADVTSITHNTIRSRYLTEDFLYSNGKKKFIPKFQRLKDAAFFSELTENWYKRKQ